MSEGEKLAKIRLSKVCKEFGLNSRPGQRAGIPRIRALTPHAREQMDEDPGRVKALDDVDLTVADGQTMAVLGPSGCGKSTLLRVIAGLEADYHGELFYDEEEMLDVPPKDRFIGMVFQKLRALPSL